MFFTETRSLTAKQRWVPCSDGRTILLLAGGEANAYHTCVAAALLSPLLSPPRLLLFTYYLYVLSRRASFLSSPVVPLVLQRDCSLEFWRRSRRGGPSCGGSISDWWLMTGVWTPFVLFRFTFSRIDFLCLFSIFFIVCVCGGVGRDWSFTAWTGPVGPRWEPNPWRVDLHVVLVCSNMAAIYLFSSL